jgi:hypothetical protein
MDEKALDEEEDKMMEIDLEELLAELNEEEEVEESINEAEEGEEDEESEESEEGEEEGEPIELEDMTDEDLKSMIEDVIKDMIEAGELEAGHEGEEGEEEAEGEEEIGIEDEEEIDLAELLREIEEIEEAEEVEEIFGLGKKSAEKGGGGTSFVKDWIANNKPEIDKIKSIEDLSARKTAAKPLITQFVSDAVRAKEDYRFDIGVLWNAFGLDDPRGGKTGSIVFEEELAEAYSTIETLKNELNEINLLNAKLLYSNKIFKSKNLNENQKVKVLSSFDKATTVGEVKMVFETLNEGIKVVKTTIKENLGSASKSTITPTAKKPIVESNEAFLRMQKLAGLI